MSKKLKESTIKDFSDRVIAHSMLPHGSLIRFTRRKTGRQVRADFTVKRRHVTAANLPVPADDDRISKFLNDVAAVLSTDLDARGIDLDLVGPNGEPFAKQKHIGKVRTIPGLPADDAANAVEMLALVIDNAGLDVDVSLLDLRSLYGELVASLGMDFERLLEKNAALIRSRGLPSAD